MTQIANQDQFRRVARALAHTGSLIAKEERYSEHLQKKDYLASLKAHADKLMGMMDAYTGQK